jgi:N-acetylmuramoyl-L-alanine amidase
MHVFNDIARTALTQYAPLRLPRVGIVIHATAGTDSLEWLQRYEGDPAKRSSSDWLIDHSGDAHQIVPRGYYAYHSGAARWQGYQEADGTINRGFFGLEVENLNDGVERFTNYQYIALAALCRYLMVQFNINPRMICMHWECALPVGRKTDPALFDWYVFIRELLHPSPDAPSFEGVY